MHKSIESLVHDAEQSGRPLPQVVLDTEAAETGVPQEPIRARIAQTLQIMRRAIDEGLEGKVRSASRDDGRAVQEAVGQRSQPAGRAGDRRRWRAPSVRWR